MAFPRAQTPINPFAMNNTLAGGDPLSDSIHKRDPNTLMRTLLDRFDWLIVAACSLGFVWLLFLIGNFYFRRRYGDHLKGFRSKENPNPAWRFNSAARSQSNNEIGVGAPFQSKVCVNYYGDSNGDSEHDMIQSCSQSSHYEDFVAVHQQQIQQQQHQFQAQRLIGQPIYSNGHSTLNRRPLKSSLSTSSTGDSSTSSRHNQLAALRLAANETRAGVMNDYALANSMPLKPVPPLPLHHQQQQPGKLAATMRESLANNNGINNTRYRTPTVSATTMKLTSNVPLINGTHNSRINLDQQQPLARQSQQQQYRFNQNIRDQSTFNPHLRAEHIYDDVIYNQMIL